MARSAYCCRDEAEVCRCSRTSWHNVSTVSLHGAACLEGERRGNIFFSTFECCLCSWMTHSSPSRDGNCSGGQIGVQTMMASIMMACYKCFNSQEFQIRLTRFLPHLHTCILSIGYVKAISNLTASDTKEESTATYQLARGESKIQCVV